MYRIVFGPARWVHSTMASMSDQGTFAVLEEGQGGVMPRVTPSTSTRSAMRRFVTLASRATTYAPPSAMAPTAVAGSRRKISTPTAMTTIEAGRSSRSLRVNPNRTWYGSPGAISLRSITAESVRAAGAGRRPVVLRVLPYGYVAQDDAANPASLLDVSLTVGTDGLIRSITATLGTSALHCGELLPLWGVMPRPSSRVTPSGNGTPPQV